MSDFKNQTFSLDEETIQALEKIVKALETDKSKFVRAAIRERVFRIGSGIGSLSQPVDAEPGPDTKGVKDGDG